MTATHSFDVAIVGAGPVGAFLANLLGSFGRRVLLLDKEADIYPLPRAVHFDGEVMRAFQRVGLAETIGAISRPSSKGMHFVSSTGQTLLVRRGYEGAGPQGWTSNYYVHQPLLEAELRKGLARFPNIEARYGVEVRHVVQDETAATLRLAEIETGSETEVQARFVVGCDGARSLVRRLIGASHEDLGLHQPWVVVDALINSGSARAKTLAEHTIQLCDPARPMTIVYVGGARRRWEIMLMPGDDPDTIAQPENIWPLLSRWIGPEDATLERAAVYTFHSVIASGWRDRRMLLAGDACHQTPPFLGQGMCAGIRDCINLGWKLEAVLAGRAAPHLLDTYESERRPHVREFITLAVELGAVIQATDPDEARRRDASFAANEPKMFDYPLPQLGSGLRVEAPIPVGQVFPQPLLHDGRRLDAVAGGRFCLIADSGFLAGLTGALADRLAAHDILILTQESVDIADWLSRHLARAVLIRPDSYVMALASTHQDIARALAILDEYSLPGGGALTNSTGYDRVCRR